MEATVKGTKRKQARTPGGKVASPVSGERIAVQEPSAPAEITFVTDREAAPVVRKTREMPSPLPLRDGSERLDGPVDESIDEPRGEAAQPEDRGAAPIEGSQLSGPAVCIICDRLKPHGIRVMTQFICDDCEAEMVRTDVDDEKYPFFCQTNAKVVVS